MKVAKEKVWRNEKGKLVEDGAEDASILVAAKGQEVPDSDVEQYDNADDFFEDVKQKSESSDSNKAPDDQDLEDCTVEDLKGIAAEEGVELEGHMLKADIIKAIKKHRKKS